MSQIFFFLIKNCKNEAIMLFFDISLPIAPLHLPSGDGSDYKLQQLKLLSKTQKLQ